MYFSNLWKHVAVIYMGRLGIHLFSRDDECGCLTMAAAELGVGELQLSTNGRPILLPDEVCLVGRVRTHS